MARIVSVDILQVDLQPKVKRTDACLLYTSDAADE